MELGGRIVVIGLGYVGLPVAVALAGVSIWERHRLGLTFKEDVPDLRNSRCFDLVRRLQWLGHEVEVADPIASPEEIQREHGLTVTRPDGRSYDLVVGAVAHRDYLELPDDRLTALVAAGGTLADLKGMWRERRLDPAVDRWTL